MFYRRFSKNRKEKDAARPAGSGFIFFDIFFIKKQRALLWHKKTAPYRFLKRGAVVPFPMIGTIRAQGEMTSGREPPETTPVLRLRLQNDLATEESNYDPFDPDL